MLAELYIQNIAVIRKTSIRLTEGLNAFTGETGAGKTMLISAIEMVLGERISRDIIRTGEEKAVVTALFENISPQAKALLEELGYEDEDGTLLISREITIGGKNTCKIGGIPATTAILRQVSSQLIHIHGQRDSNQILLKEHHLGLIDSYGELAGELEKYRQAFRKLRELEAELTSLSMDEAQKAQRIDMLTYQIKEIEEASLEDEGEEEALLSHRTVIRNSAKILEGLSAGYAALDGDGEGGEGINSLFGLLLEGMQIPAQYIEALAPTYARLEEMSYELAECAGDLRRYLDEFEFDPSELDGIERRLDTIYKLKKKYGEGVPEILDYLGRAQQELDGIVTSDERSKELQDQLYAQTELCKKLAAGLSKKRKKAASAFMRGVEGELAFLDMPSVKLSVEVKQMELMSSGIDDLEFMIVTNVGETPKPLNKIASGGEIARIMLAIKNVLAHKDHIDTLIFDEVDTGVSGRAAGKIGQKLGQVAKDRQVICVTHLAQVAAFANHHLLIRKEVEKNRTITQVSELDSEQRVEELARIVSGDLVSDAARKNARELLDQSQKLLDN